MTVAEKIEVLTIPIAGIGILLTPSALPSEVGIGRLLLGASALLLLQSLVRDLWLLARKRRAEQPASRRKARCMCIESVVGATGVLVGAMLLGFGIDRAVAMSGWRWSALVMVVLGVGFGIKDYVLEWNPWRLRKDEDHINIVFTWKT